METNKDVIIYNLITTGAINMLTSDGPTIPSKDNLAVKGHPYWSQPILDGGSVAVAARLPITLDVSMLQILCFISNHKAHDLVLCRAYIDFSSAVVPILVPKDTYF
jgi:hypothetical protein